MMETLFNMQETDKLHGPVNEEIKILYIYDKIIIIYFEYIRLNNK